MRWLFSFFNMDDNIRKDKQMHTEYGYACCGGSIPITTDSPLNCCNECRTKTDADKMGRFQCSENTRNILYRLCAHKDLEQLRLHPDTFIYTINKRLLAIYPEHPMLTVNMEATPPRIN